MHLIREEPHLWREPQSIRFLIILCSSFWLSSVFVNAESGGDSRSNDVLKGFHFPDFCWLWENINIYFTPTREQYFVGKTELSSCGCIFISTCVFSGKFLEFPVHQQFFSTTEHRWSAPACNVLNVPFEACETVKFFDLSVWLRISFQVNNVHRNWRCYGAHFGTSK
jgi:hypothetical protein